jgi:hypothetical protein
LRLLAAIVPLAQRQAVEQMIVRIANFARTRIM